MSDFWDSRYATNEYVYGKKPNDFLSQQLPQMKPGKILFAAEGEGRNAVYAAGLGFDVFAFDASEVAKNKALRLAQSQNVSINYKTAAYQDVVYPENLFDVLVLIFAHMPPQFRTEWHRKLVRYLKPGGVLLLEGFARDQLQFSSGGPKDVTMLFSEDDLKNDFGHLATLHIEAKHRMLAEGSFHRGKASVLQLVATK